MRTTITVSCPVAESPRVAQVRGLFDLPAEKTSALRWEVVLPMEQRPWNVGLICGPSGSGKSTIARHLFRDALWADDLPPWPDGRAVVDGFPAVVPVKEVTALLSAVGFSSPPAWLRPYAVLSTGQRFRCDLARLLSAASPGRVAVLDEFTSVVDRTVARVGSAAVARAVRARGLSLVAVSCHEDVIDWLQPDWVYRPAESAFNWRCLQRRPAIPLEVFRCRASAWPLFAPAHYLSGALHRSAVCFLAGWQGRPVGFSAWLPFVGAGRPTRREHRTVVLPDFQGVGIGNALSDFCASLWTGLGYRATSTTTHPALIRSRLRSPRWRLTRRPALASGHEGKLRHATTRLTAGFAYVGPPLHRANAEALLR